MIQATHKYQQKRIPLPIWHVQMSNLRESILHLMHFDTLAAIYSDYIQEACGLGEDYHDGEKTQSLGGDTAKALSASSLLYDTHSSY